VKDDTENMEEITEERKKRVAHPSAATSVTRQIGPSQLPKKHTNPYQKMCERWHLMKKAAAEKAAEKATEKAATDMKTQTISTLIDRSSSSTTQRVSVHKEHVESNSSISNNDMLPNTNGKLDICKIIVLFD